MKYENANDVLPEELVKAIQKYAAGKLLYIPSGDEKKGWGETSGYRDQLNRRNRMICNKYARGMTVSELADAYYLSLDTIKKIIYSKKPDKQLSYEPTVSSAVNYASVGMLEEWMQCSLLFTWQDAPPLQELLNEECTYFGVVKFPLRLIQTEGLKPVGAKGDDVQADAAARPPLLVKYEEGKFYTIVQSELLGALKQRKVNAYPTIILLTGNADYKSFMRLYGSVLFFVDRV
ncbi:CD3324 family protein [Paenibacillus silvisoli]|uniref:CD3324 family protein n=1 Tax=Paenibacillus silvisoli TaxID=3110539 RepID=UPI0028047839|nr:CD3324 family protein [Paenibacillus silvisoli]